MATRVRLTDPRRNASKRIAVEDSIPYPGTVNQPNRKFRRRDEYHTFEHSRNHETPDMRTEWRDDSHDEIGFGIPDTRGPMVASVRVAANKAVRVAVLLLGDKVDGDTIEAQARDFMSMDVRALDRTISRFAETQDLYEDEAEEVVASDELADPASGRTDEVVAAEAPAAKAPVVEAPAAKEPVVEAPVVKASVAEAPVVKASVADAPAAKAPVVEEPVVAADETIEDIIAEDEEVEDEVTEASDEDGENGEMDIEFTGSADMDDTGDAAADLEGVFDEAPKTASTPRARKAGIKRLGGQPRVASASGVADSLSSLWDSAPDLDQIW
jgi:hypothetical protein